MTAIILLPTGRLDTAAAPGFEREIMAAIQSGAKQMLIDLAELVYVSSAGLRVLLVAAKRMRSEGGRVAFCGLRPQVAEVFDISGFAAILQVYPDRADVLKAWG